MFSIKSPFPRSQEVVCGGEQRKWPDAEELKRTKEAILRLLKAKKTAETWVLSYFPYRPSLNAFLLTKLSDGFLRSCQGGTQGTVQLNG